jgi:glutathione synthase/RimK-type ligase-like ATP-grasp enzyme
MHVNIGILTKVLNDLGLAYKDVPYFPDAIIFQDNFFVRSSTPFNTQSVSLITRDKWAAHSLLEGKLLMPKTRAFHDPQGKYPEYALKKNIGDIVKSSDFVYPCIIKMNQGERGANVYIAENDTEALQALEIIFDKKSKHYDYISLVQEYIKPKHEYRAISVYGSIALIYDRESKKIAQSTKSEHMREMALIVQKELGFNWGAVDFLESEDGKLYFLEANTKPEFEGLIEENGVDQVRELYKIAVKKFLSQ